MYLVVAQPGESRCSDSSTGGAAVVHVITAVVVELLEALTVGEGTAGKITIE